MILFTCVSIDDLCEFLLEELNNRDNIFPFSIQVLINLIKLCVNNNYFSFNDNYYKQSFGLSMGNPLSPVLSNIYMEFFETKLLSSILDPTVVWMRYIDDVICLWPYHDDLNKFLEKLNGLVPSIKFSYEVEVDGRLPFLDVYANKNSNNRFDYDIYRKPTSNNSYIHYYSVHSDSDWLNSRK